jgi:hypothetical protein
MKNNVIITSFADLDREEIRVRKRIKKQEEEIKLKLKTLPEEIVTTGITKIVTNILNGELFRSAISIIKTVGSAISGNKEGSEKGGGILNLIKTIVKDKLSN